MTYQEKLILLIKYENQLVKEDLSIESIVNEDIQDIFNWSDETAKAVWQELVFFNEIGSVFAYPWCILSTYLDTPCADCTYGHRHGICGVEKGNRYSILMSAFNNKYDHTPKDLYAPYKLKLKIQVEELDRLLDTEQLTENYKHRDIIYKEITLSNNDILCIKKYACNKVTYNIRSYGEYLHRTFKRVTKKSLKDKDLLKYIPEM